MIMAKFNIVVWLLLVINLGNLSVKGQSTFDDYYRDEQDIVNILSKFVKDLHMHNSDAWITLTEGFQSELQNFKAQISRLEDRIERHDTYMSDSIGNIESQVQAANNDIKAEISSQKELHERHLEEIKRQVETANNDIKVQVSRLEDRVSRLEDRIERHDTYMKSSIEEIKRQTGTANKDIKAQISRLEDRVERHDTHLNYSIGEIESQVQTAKNDTRAQITRLDNRVELHDTHLNYSMGKIESQVQTAKNDTRAQITRLDNRVELHDTHLNYSMGKIQSQVETAKSDTKAQITHLDNRVELHDTHLNYSMGKIESQVETAKNDTIVQISRVENRLESHNTYMSNSLQENKREMQTKNTEMENELQRLDQKLFSRRCPTGFNYGVAGHSKCYAVLEARVNWNTAQQRCRRLHTNAHLAVIINSRETQITTEILQNHDCTQRNGQDLGNAFWIGAQRMNISDCNSTFEWKTNNGTTFPIQYSNWGTGIEPKCLYHIIEACASISKYAGVKSWNDLACTWFACPLCEVTLYD